MSSISQISQLSSNVVVQDVFQEFSPLLWFHLPTVGATISPPGIQRQVDSLKVRVHRLESGSHVDQETTISFQRFEGNPFRSMHLLKQTSDNVACFVPLPLSNRLEHPFRIYLGNHASPSTWSDTWSRRPYFPDGNLDSKMLETGRTTMENLPCVFNGGTAPSPIINESDNRASDGFPLFIPLVHPGKTWIKVRIPREIEYNSIPS
eukprot:scaffold1051_cov119-Cylindrotheca_fusiformis.AAC.13